MSISITASNYVFNSQTPFAPSISVNIQTATSSQVESATLAYLEEADAYASSFESLVATREYIKDRIQKDIAIQCEGLTSDGVNLQTNKITMHNKADNVYAMSFTSTSIFSTTAINSAVSRYGSLHSQICMDDDPENGTALVSSFAEQEDYDINAISITVGGSSAIFINDRPNATGTERTFTAYTAELGGNGVYENTAEYTLSYGVSVPVDGSSVEAWTITEAGQSAPSYYSTTLDGEFQVIPGASSSESSSEG